MSEFKFNIVGKDGKVIEDLMFDDIDSVADYMLDAADKWYAGLQDPGDNIIIERIEDGKVVFEDKSSFGGDDYGRGVERELVESPITDGLSIVSDREVGDTDEESPE
jgi:hypothetical protein